MNITANILDDNLIILDDFNPTAIIKKIAARLKQRRLHLNYTQVLLSEKSGVSLGSIKRFENSYKISLEHLLKLALVLDALDEFHNIFPVNNYNSINDIINTKKSNKRKRASNV